MDYNEIVFCRELPIQPSDPRLLRETVSVWRCNIELTHRFRLRANIYNILAFVRVLRHHAPVHRIRIRRRADFSGIPLWRTNDRRISPLSSLVPLSLPDTLPPTLSPGSRGSKGNSERKSLWNRSDNITDRF